MVPLTPSPIISSTELGSMSVLFTAATAFAKGWRECRSSAATASKSSSETWISTTEGCPWVRVPVLSMSTIPTSFAVWIASAFRIISPFLEAAPVPVIRAIGVASPKAQGQAMTMVDMKPKMARERGSLTVVTHGR